MRFIRYTNATGITLGVCRGDEVVDLAVAAPDLPRDLPTLLALGASGSALVQSAIERAPARAVRTRAEIKALVPIAQPEKIICIGLNYTEHIKEAPTPQEVPSYPVIFLRTAGTLIAHGEPLRRPRCFDQFDRDRHALRRRHRPQAAAVDEARGCLHGRRRRRRAAQQPGGRRRD